LLGSVFLYVDYTVPVEEVPAELSRIVKSTNLWKGKVCALQVSDAKEGTLQLRALVDAHDSGAAWDLRCYVREKLVRNRLPPFSAITSASEDERHKGDRKRKRPRT
jgi:hypothetical protein